MRQRVIIILLVVIGLTAAARWLGGQIGLAPDTLKETLDGFGAWGPVVYVIVLISRHFIALPSSLALTIGGAIFPLGIATIAGSIGLFVSAIVDFWFFRTVKPQAMMERLEAQAGGATRAAERSTPLVLLVATAIPPLPQTMSYFGAAMTKLSYARFVAIVGPSGIPRAFILALLGGGLVAGNMQVTLLATAAVVVGCSLAMLSPTIRQALVPRTTTG